MYYPDGQEPPPPRANDDMFVLDIQQGGWQGGVII